MTHLPASTSWYTDHARLELESVKLYEIASLDFLQAIFNGGFVANVKLFAYQHIQGAPTAGNEKCTMWIWGRKWPHRITEVAKIMSGKKKGRGRVKRSGNELCTREQNQSSVWLWGATRTPVCEAGTHRYTFWLCIPKWNLQLPPSLPHPLGSSSSIFFFSLCGNSPDLNTVSYIFKNHHIFWMFRV